MVDAERVTAPFFVSDPSAEAERLAQALRSAGHVVVDVPAAMLIARVAVQPPVAVFLDADTERLSDVIERLRELPEGQAVTIILLGEPRDDVEASVEDAIMAFARPIDIGDVTMRAEALVRMSRYSIPLSSPPSQPPSVRPMPLPSPSVASIVPPPPPSLRGLHEPVSPELSRLLSAAEDRVAGLVFETVPPSPQEELESVLPEEYLRSLDAPLDALEEELHDAGHVGHARSTTSGASNRSTTGETGPEGTGHGASSLTSGTGTGVGTDAGSSAGRFSAASSTISPSASSPSPPGVSSAAMSVASPSTSSSYSGDSPHEPQVTVAHRIRPTSSRDAETPRPPLVVQNSPAQASQGSSRPGPSFQAQNSTLSSSELNAMFLAGRASQGGDHASLAPVTSPTASTPTSSSQQNAQNASQHSSPQAQSSSQQGHGSSQQHSSPQYSSQQHSSHQHGASAHSGHAATTSSPMTLVDPLDAARVLANAIVLRTSGSLSFQSTSEDALRRVLLRDGDLLLVTSSLESESLVAFLVERGMLANERLDLIHTLPPFGKRAVAPLIARGLLARDQMWNVLRAHAEWMLGRALVMTHGSVAHEPEIPARLRDEDPVFGGSTGAEVFVDVSRRIVPEDVAITFLGGKDIRLAPGQHRALSSELRGRTSALIDEWSQQSLERVLAGEEQDAAVLVWALVQLKILEVQTARENRGSRAVPAASASLDFEAVRERVRARLSIVENGDYFAVLGVEHQATGYEIRRAYLELRRTFEPANLLSTELAELMPDVRHVVRVIEEAYDILKDDERRARYRTAIDSVPDWGSR